MKYKLAIFDFDGTLADSFPFFMGSFNTVAEKHGFKAIPAEEVPGFRHFGAREMMRHVGLPMWKLPRVARTFLSLMREQAAGITVFEGVRETLQSLHQQGVTLAVVTSNSADNVAKILGEDTSSLMCLIECGHSIFGKQTGIKRVLKKTGFRHEDTIYIGDQISDLEGARKAKVAFGAVAWGYGTVESLQAHGPDEVFTSVSDWGLIAS